MRIGLGARMFFLFFFLRLLFFSLFFIGLFYYFCGIFTKKIYILANFFFE